MREDWAETIIGNVADYLNGRGFKKSEWKTEGLPIIRIQNLNKDDAPFNYTQNSYEDKYSVKNGDLLFSWSASLGVYIWNRGDAWLNQHIFKVVPKDFILKDYLYHNLQSIIQQLYAKTHGSGMVHITKKNFEATKFHLPPLNEQRAIVKKIEELFSDLDKGVADLKKAQHQLKIYRQAVLKKAFEGKLTNEKSEPEIIKLGYVISKPRYGTSKKCSLDPKGIAVLRIPNIGEGLLNIEELKYAEFNEEEISKLKLEEGDILTIRSNGSVDLVGKCALITKNDVDYLYAGYLIRLRPKKELIDSKFLLYSLKSHNLRVQIESKAKSTSGVNNINSGELASLEIPYFKIEIQHQIVQEIESRLSVCDKVEESITESLGRAEALRQSILKKAFEGNLLSTQEIEKCKSAPDYEPAAVLLEKIKMKQ